MDRRQFLAVGGLAASTPLFAQVAATGASADPEAGLFKGINFTSDGLGLNPLEYATLLREVTTIRNIQVDYYSNGGVIAELEKQFAQLLGKEAAMFVPTGTLANYSDS